MLSVLAACGQGTFIYDQSSATNRSFSGGSPIESQQPTGQAFTPSLSSVGFVQMEFDDFYPGNGTGATVYVNLRADSIGGPILSSTDPVFMPDGFAYGITNFFFPTSVAVSAGTTYYFQPVVQSGDHWDIINGPYGYPGGTFYWNGSPDPNGFDAWFREGVLTPEPSSAVLLLFGAASLWAARRARRSRGSPLFSILAVGAAVSVFTANAQTTQTHTGVAYFSQQHSDWPPFPVPTEGCGVVSIPGQPGCFEILDLAHDYPAAELAEGPQANLSPNSPLGPSPLGPDYGTNLWLEITNIIAGDLYVLVHNAEPGAYVELLSKTDLVKEVDWSVEQVTGLDSGSPPDVLFMVPENGRPTLFFRALAGAQTLVGIDTSPGNIINAIRPGPCYPGQPGIFTIRREGYLGNDSSLMVCYRVSGTATNGLDYTNVNGSVIIPSGHDSWTIEADALSSLILTNRTLTITLVITNGYVLDPNNGYVSSATILVEPNVFSLVATNIQNPIGLDYHTLTDSLLVSVDPYYCASNFVRIDASGNVSHWADVTNLLNPTPLATVKTTANGFQEGATYFCGFAPSVGWLSPNGDDSIRDWVVLNEYAWGLGGLYVDQSGAWGGDLIVTTGGDNTPGEEVGGGVWRIRADGVATQVVYLATCLGGVITLTNDTARWGPWSGKVITGQDYEEYPEFPEIYAVDTAGQVLTYTNLGIQPEQVSLIPPSQPFYFCDTDNNAIWEVPYTAFTNHVGQLLMTGPGDSLHRPALYVVHYDAGATNQFVAEQIDLPEFIGRLEQGAFAPLTNMPCLDH
jgi:hypothetical protein